MRRAFPGSANNRLQEKGRITMGGMGGTVIFGSMRAWGMKFLGLLDAMKRTKRICLSLDFCYGFSF